MSTVVCVFADVRHCSKRGQARAQKQIGASKLSHTTVAQTLGSSLTLWYGILPRIHSGSESRFLSDMDVANVEAEH